MVGMISFLQLFWFMNLHRFHFHTGGRSNIELVVIGIMIIIGLVKAFISLHRLVKNYMEKWLLIAETMIIEVQ